jgi:outer membrane protein
MYRVRTPLLLAALAAGPAAAADPSWTDNGAPLALRGGYVHIGVAYTKQADQGSLTLGGAPVPGAAYTTEAGITPSLEVGLLWRNGFGISLSGIYPMTTPNTAAGTLAGMGNLGTETVGFYSITGHYHFMTNATFSPYVGGGVGYMHVFGTTDGVISNLKIGSAVGGVIQAGIDVYLTDQIGAFVDVKRYFISTTATGMVGPNPAVASTTVDPWVFSAGTTISF